MGPQGLEHQPCRQNHAVNGAVVVRDTGGQERANVVPFSLSLWTLLIQEGRNWSYPPSLVSVRFSSVVILVPFLS